MFIASIKDKCFYLDEIQITLKKANLQFAIFQILMNARSRWRIYSTPRNLTVNQIIEELEKMDRIVLDEKQVIEAIHKIRKNINKKCGTDIGNEIIESVEDGGYQIGLKVALI